VPSQKAYILKVKYKKTRLAAGLRQTRWGSLQRSPRPLAGLKGPTSNGGEGKGGKRRGREGKARGGEREGREERGGERKWKGKGDGKRT